jgi:hypothetical protein
MSQQPTQPMQPTPNASALLRASKEYAAANRFALTRRIADAKIINAIKRT